MIHLSGSDSENIVKRAIDEYLIYEKEGLDGVIVENYHGSIEDVESVLKQLNLYRIDRRKHNAYNLPDNPELSLGVNILPNNYKTAFYLADKYNADFIQLDYISGTYNKSEVLDVDGLYIFAEKYNDIQLLGGVWPKYYTPIEGSNLSDDIYDAMNISDAIVVTGAGTGKETLITKIQSFKIAIYGHALELKHPDYPLIIGAGLNSSNVEEQLALADGAIVGSCFKPYGITTEMVSRDLVREFMEKANKVREKF